MTAPAKKPHHVFSQEHAIRMYQCLGLVLRGLEAGHIKAKPIVSIDDESEDAILSINDIVAAAMSPSDNKLAVGFPATSAMKEPT